MQSFKLVKSTNQESEDPNDTPHLSRAGISGQKIVYRSISIMLKLACGTKRKQLNEKFFSEFNPTEQTFLKKFYSSESDITDSELRHLLRTLIIENNDVFSKFT